MPLDALTTYADLAKQHGVVPADHQAPRFFPVSARKVFDERGDELPGWLRIARDDTGSTLNLASEGYKLITNEMAFEAFEAAIRSSNLSWRNMMIGTDFSHGGARVFRQYLFPDHMVQVKPGVDVALRIIMLNSYDGSLAFRGTAGAFNFVCANTAIIGREVAGFRIRHSGSNDITGGIKSLVGAAEAFVEETDRWKTWPLIDVTDAQAIEVFKKIPQATEPLVADLSLRWLRARDHDLKQGGPNLWCLYNVLTAWATHDATKGKDSFAHTRHEREVRVRKVIDGDAWADILEAA
jgi:hypothetical protein